jgi:beta-galactosidase/beta-glucuronidase
MRQEYPRPNFMRADWYSLNGKWTFISNQKTSSIEVPFACQTQLSGCEQPAADHMEYRRTFTVPHEWKGKDILLHFGAVDYQCTVSINGNIVGRHTGGHTPFTYNITPYLTGKEESLTVKVYDPLEDETIPRGKQFWAGKPRFIWYTPTSGIWQSVWLEPVEKTALKSLQFTPDIDKGTCCLRWQLRKDAALPCTLAISVTLKGDPVFEGTTVCHSTSGELTMDIFHNRALAGSFHFVGSYWSPESPLLYETTLIVRTKETVWDKVQSYFGMRQVTAQDGRIYLNHRPCYQKLLLDQGYWKDGGLTAPTDEDYRDDILKMKAMGFNGCRLHEKVEDPRFLYWADRLGFLVWEAMPSFWSYTPDAGAAFMAEWRDTIRRDYSHPCIIAWEMLNESWGVPHIYDDPMQQSFARSLYYMAKSMDDTRLVVGNDGWEQTDSDICALHSYQHGSEGDLLQQRKFSDCLKQPERIGEIMEKVPYALGTNYTGQPLVLTECGGVSVTPRSTDAVQATDKSENWGYTAVDAEHFLETYHRIVCAIRDAARFCGFCYTQLTDIQQEKNGLLTEAHKYKFAAEKLFEINAILK